MPYKKGSELIAKTETELQAEKPERLADYWLNSRVVGDMLATWAITPNSYKPTRQADNIDFGDIHVTSVAYPATIYTGIEFMCDEPPSVVVSVSIANDTLYSVMLVLTYNNFDTTIVYDYRADRLVLSSYYSAGKV